jgi:hypothetical protein
MSNRLSLTPPKKTEAKTPLNDVYRLYCICNKTIACFVTNRMQTLLTRKLLNQVFLLVKVKSSFRNYYGRHRYGIPVSLVNGNTIDIFDKNNRKHFVAGCYILYF